MTPVMWLLLNIYLVIYGWKPNQLILAPIMKLGIKESNKFMTIQCVSVHAILYSVLVHDLAPWYVLAIVLDIIVMNWCQRKG